MDQAYSKLDQLSLNCWLNMDRHAFSCLPVINKEVDFIATNAEEKRYIQATESMNKPTTRERELAPPRIIRDNYALSGMKTGDGCIWVPYLNELKHKLDFFDKL